jgi:hypothetical protein
MVLGFRGRPSGSGFHVVRCVLSVVFEVAEFFGKRNSTKEV